MIYTSGWTSKSVLARAQSCQAAVSGARDLREVYFSGFTMAFFPSSLALRKELLSQLTHRGPHRPFSSAVGKVPGDAEYVSLYVHAMESVCP